MRLCVTPWWIWESIRAESLSEYRSDDTLINAFQNVGNVLAFRMVMGGVQA